MQFFSGATFDRAVNSRLIAFMNLFIKTLDNPLFIKKAEKFGPSVLNVHIFNFDNNFLSLIFASSFGRLEGIGGESVLWNTFGNIACNVVESESSWPSHLR